VAPMAHNAAVAMRVRVTVLLVTFTVVSWVG
jgi:hypothetical protein